MDEKDLRKKKTELEGEHARAMSRIESLERQLAEARTVAVRIEGAHALIMGMIEDAKKEKEGLQKPDAPSPGKKEEPLVAEVVKDEEATKIIQ